MACSNFIQAFNQAEQTIINVSADLRSLICGNIPTIDVYHRQPDPDNPGSYKFVAQTLQVKLYGMPLTKIEIDHGGRATGYVKIK